MGGTEGIGRMIAAALAERGVKAIAVPADDVKGIEAFDAVIVGGALYANRWPANVRRFVRRNVRQLRRVPVWFFSSGPLDDSADREAIAPPTEIAVLAERVGAKGHVTFGGRLDPDAKSFPAREMAKTSSGDFRNPERVRAWAGQLADELPHAKHGEPIEHAARSIPRLVAYGVLGWAILALITLALSAIASLGTALVLHAIVAPFVFVTLAWRYFRARGAREGLLTAITWTAIVAVLHLVILAGAIHRSMDMFASVGGTWLAFVLVFLSTWATGSLMATMPWPKPEERSKARASA